MGRRFVAHTNGLEWDARIVHDNFYELFNGTVEPRGGTDMTPTTSVYDLGAANRNWVLAVQSITVVGNLIIDYSNVNTSYYFKVNGTGAYSIDLSGVPIYTRRIAYYYAPQATGTAALSQTIAHSVGSSFQVVDVAIWCQDSNGFMNSEFPGRLLNYGIPEVSATSGDYTGTNTAAWEVSVNSTNVMFTIAYPRSDATGTVWIDLKYVTASLLTEVVW